MCHSVILSPGRDDTQIWVTELTKLANDLGLELLIVLRGRHQVNNWGPVDRRYWDNSKRDLCESFAGCGSYGRIKLHNIIFLRIPFTQEQIISLILYKIFRSTNTINSSRIRNNELYPCEILHSLSTEMHVEMNDFKCFHYGNRGNRQLSCPRGSESARNFFQTGV